MRKRNVSCCALVVLISNPAISHYIVIAEAEKKAQEELERKLAAEQEERERIAEMKRKAEEEKRREEEAKRLGEEMVRFD